MVNIGMINLLLVSLVLCQQPPSQTDRESIEDRRLRFYQQSILENQNSNVNAFGDAKLDHFIDIAEAAIKKLDTPNRAPDEIRSLANNLQVRLTDVLTNDAGRWFATDENLVRLFISFDTDALLISDRAIASRANRLRAAVTELKKFNATQGDFDPASNTPVKAILADSVWVRDMQSKLSNRAAVIEQMIKDVPKGRDFSNLPTLADAKRKLMASDTMAYEKAQIAARQQARSQAQQTELKATKDRVLLQASAETEAKDRLAGYSRDLMRAEYEKEIELLRSEIEMLRQKKLKVEQDRREAVAGANQARIETYLKSPRVRQLLSPFISSGTMEFGAFNKTFKIEGLEARPASWGRISSASYPGIRRPMKQLEPTRAGVTDLVYLVTLPHNDRGRWPVTKDNWEQAGNTFKNIDGKMVNPYVEAQRILREHNQLLIKLGMLAK